MVNITFELNQLWLEILLANPRRMKRDHGSKRKGGNNGTNGKELIRSFPFVPLFPPFLLDP
jgi:hypothetical protein